jgi:hypothetical protein
MRLVFLTLVCALVLSACVASKSDKSGVFPDGKTAGLAAPESDKSTLRNYLSGKIVSLNPKLRIVVMDFPIRRMPVTDQKLNVYRDGQKVGVVRATGPTMETTIAGDVLVGEVQVGDEVSDD